MSISFHHVKNLMRRRQSQLSHCGLLEATAKSRWLWPSQSLWDLLVDMPLALALCVDSRCKLNVVIFVFYCCVVSKYFFRACVKQLGISFP